MAALRRRVAEKKHSAALAAPTLHEEPHLLSHPAHGVSLPQGPAAPSDMDMEALLQHTLAALRHEQQLGRQDRGGEIGDASRTETARLIDDAVHALAAYMVHAGLGDSEMAAAAQLKDGSAAARNSSGGALPTAFAASLEAERPPAAAAAAQPLNGGGGGAPAYVVPEGSDDYRDVD